MAGAGEDLEPRVRDRRHEVLAGRKAHLVEVAAQHEGGDGDVPHQIPRRWPLLLRARVGRGERDGVHGEEEVTYRARHPAFRGRPSVEPGVGLDPVQRVQVVSLLRGLVGVPQRLHPRGAVRRVVFGAAAGAGTDEHQRRDPLRMSECQLDAPATAVRRADHRGAVDASRIEHRDSVGHGIVGLRFVGGLAEAATVVGDRAVALVEVGDQRGPAAPIGHARMHQEHRRTDASRS